MKHHFLVLISSGLGEDPVHWWWGQWVLIPVLHLLQLKHCHCYNDCGSNDVDPHRRRSLREHEKGKTQQSRLLWEVERIVTAYSGKEAPIKTIWCQIYNSQVLLKWHIDAFTHTVLFNAAQRCYKLIHTAIITVYFVESWRVSQLALVWLLW